MRGLIIVLVIILLNYTSGDAEESLLSDPNDVRTMVSANTV